MIKVYNKNMKIIYVMKRRSSYAKNCVGTHDLHKLVEKALALKPSGAKTVDLRRYQDWGLDTLEEMPV